MDGKEVALGYIRLRRSYGTDLVIVEILSKESGASLLELSDATRPFKGALRSALLTTLALAAFLAPVVFFPFLFNNTERNAHR